MTDIDKELAAMKRIANALQDVDGEAKDRIVRWLMETHKAHVEPEDGEPQTPLKLKPKTERSEQ